LKNPVKNWLQKFTVPVFLEITFHKSSELQGKKKVVDLLLMNPLGAPRMNWWTIHRTMHSVMDFRHCTNCSACFLNVLIFHLCLGLIM